MLKYVIYGAGKNGIALLDKLKKAGLAIDFFCDCDFTKQTQKSGISIISPQELARIKDEVYVFVSPKKSEEIYEFLKQENFPYVCPPELIYVLAKLSLETSREIPSWPMYTPGHYHSLYPDLEDFKRRKQEIYNSKEISEINLNIDTQLEIYSHLTGFYEDLPDWPEINTPQNDERLHKYRYRYFNLSFSPGDSIHLHCMLRYLKPKRVIEVGSGFTSAVMLDTNEYYMKDKIDISFIEPYPVTLKSILKPDDNIVLTEKGLQAIPLSYFDKLESGDILFIDSSHVSKVGSDVNYLFFSILPHLKPGVYVHLHDIFYPFEYPEGWIIKGMIWNELYLLRAFLLYNKQWEICFFQNFLEKEYRERMAQSWLSPYQFHGGSFWMRKSNN